MITDDRPLAVFTGIDLACKIAALIFFGGAIGMLAYAFLAFAHVLPWWN